MSIIEPSHNHNSDLSYSKAKRNTMDARLEYFKHNPGLFGCLWICPYCWSIVVGKKNVEVDHYVPLDSVLGYNKRFNLTASCMECNRHKSNKLESGYVIKAIFGIVIFKSLLAIQYVFILIFMILWLAIKLVGKLIISAFMAPFRSTNIGIKLLAVAVYVLLFLHIFSKL